MTVRELRDQLVQMPLDDEVYIRILDSDEEPMWTLVTGVTDDPEGIMIRGGDQVTFDG